MNRFIRTLALPALLALPVAAGQLHAQNDNANANQRTRADQLRADMRKLWEEHIVWTRNFIISAAAGSPDVQPVTDRLMRNQVDIGNAVKAFYGDDAGNQLTNLLKGHIATAAEVVNAAKANNQSRLRTAQQRWTANADSIATFLAGANRFWPENILKDEMHRHLELTTNEAVARLHGDWAADIRAYDQVHEHILHLSDLLSDGIIRQFPDRVASRD